VTRVGCEESAVFLSEPLQGVPLSTALDAAVNR
jgi:hypothetical protein